MNNYACLQLILGSFLYQIQFAMDFVTFMHDSAIHRDSSPRTELPKT